MHFHLLTLQFYHLSTHPFIGFYVYTPINHRQPTLTHQDEEAKELATTMMSKKTSRLYQRMQHGIKGKDDEVALLKQKAAQAETEAETSAKNSGKGKVQAKPAEKGRDKTAAAKPSAKKSKK